MGERRSEEKVRKRRRRREISKKRRRREYQYNYVLGDVMILTTRDVDYFLNYTLLLRLFYYYSYY